MSQCKKSGDVYWNHGKTPIYISLDMKIDPKGYGGTEETKIIIMPGHGIDLSILDLKKGKP